MLCSVSIFSRHRRDLTVYNNIPDNTAKGKTATRIKNSWCSEMIVYFVYQNNVHTIAQKQLCTCCVLYLECSWKCIVPKSLLSWNLSPESRLKGSQELNKHSWSTDSPCLRTDALPLISISLPCLSQRWIAPMVWLWCRGLPSSDLLIWGHRGLFGTSRQPSLPSLTLAELPWFQGYMNATEMKFSWGLYCIKCRTIILHATLWNL